MTLLSIARDVADEIGILAPDALIGNADLTARRIMACAKAAGEELYRKADWSILQREHVFETVADEENYPVPDDFGRAVQTTAWDRTAYRAIRGRSPRPSGSGAAPAISGCRHAVHFRLLVGPLAGSILLEPVPTVTGTELIYEYVTNQWAESDVRRGQAGWLADTDEIRLDNELFRRELLWRVKRALGQDYADERNDAEHGAT